MQLRYLILAGLLLAACAPISQPANESSATTEPNHTLSPTSEVVTETPELPTPHGLTLVEPTRLPETAAIPPELWEKIAADLEARTSANRADFTISRAEAIIWNDGSLGCPQPGVFYTQALVDGYRVVVDWNGQQFDYHAATSGFFMLCERSRPGFQNNPPPTSTP
ncbi:MAG: hypothetical protein ACT4QE_14915 [Anaerolineales bacterium]